MMHTAPLVEYLVNELLVEVPHIPASTADARTNINKRKTLAGDDDDENIFIENWDHRGTLSGGIFAQNLNAACNME
jgi:hypothetical protein